jgi:AcrR family transcriptional regulator
METESNSKKVQILATGKELFWKFGFKRVTIEEICREAGVSKMTFYKFFPNKTKLATAIMDVVFEESLLKIRKIDKEHESADKTFKKFLQLKSEGSRDISEEFIKDLYTNPDPGLKTYMEKKTKSMLEEIQRVYEHGKETGWVRKDLNIPFLILFSQKLVSLTNDKGMMQFFDSPQDLIMEITNLFIYGISPHE